VERDRMLTILQMNDSHAYFSSHQEAYWGGTGTTYARAGGYSRIATIANELRNKSRGSFLFLDNGDALHGTAPAVRTEGAAVVPILNALGLDAMTGHWEFAYGPETLQQRVGEMSFPFLAANVYRKETGERPFRPWTVIEKGGLRVGIIGLAAFIIDKTMPEHFHKGLSFTLGRNELPDLISHLRGEEKADLIVLLSHLGLPQDLRLVSEVNGIDICLSGHTHNRLFAPIVQGRTIVIQSGSHGSFLGTLALTMSSGQIASFDHRLISVNEQTPAHPAVEKLVNNIVDRDGPDLNQVVGETNVPLDRMGALECTMDSFLLLAIRDAVNAEVAFSNGWRYGAPIVPGNILLNDLYNIVPMDPPVSTVLLSGEAIWAMLEENLERTYSRNPYQQMGGYVKRATGIRAYFKVENPPGHRLQKIYVNGQPLESDRRYFTAFVTEQGVTLKYGEQRTESGLSAVQVMQAYLSKHGPLAFALEGTFVPV
jgi:S-sulfosulfanyl-L-cysteine sulfohydrolase